MHPVVIVVIVVGPIVGSVVVSFVLKGQVVLVISVTIFGLQRSKRSLVVVVVAASCCCCCYPPTLVVVDVVVDFVSLTIQSLGIENLFWHSNVLTSSNSRSIFVPIVVVRRPLVTISVRRFAVAGAAVADVVAVESSLHHQ